MTEANIGEKIKAARLQKGYTQEELGNLIGVQKSAVAKYEKGRVVNIKRSVLAKLSKVLDIPPAELVGWTEATSEQTKNSDTIADITDKMFKDSNFMEAVKLLNELDQKQIVRAKELLHLFFKEGFDENE